jgi:hypothetical protein
MFVGMSAMTAVLTLFFLVYFADSYGHVTSVFQLFVPELNSANDLSNEISARIVKNYRVSTSSPIKSNLSVVDKQSGLSVFDKQSNFTSVFDKQSSGSLSVLVPKNVTDLSDVTNQPSTNLVRLSSSTPKQTADSTSTLGANRTLQGSAGDVKTEIMGCIGADPSLGEVEDLLCMVSNSTGMTSRFLCIGLLLE